MDTREACAMAVELMSKHGLLNETPSTWQFQWDNARRRFGCCNYRARVISLSKPLVELNALDAVRDVILHEIAHALTPNAGHGRLWQLQAMAIGAKPERCVSASAVVVPKGKWIAECPNCHTQVHRYKRPKTSKRIACGKCCNGRFDERYVLNFAEISQ